MVVRFHVWLVFFTALNALHATWSSHKKAVCLSVCSSVCPSVKRVIWDETKESYAHIVIPHGWLNDHLSSFMKRRMVGGDDRFYLKFWVNWPRWSKNANFQSIIIILIITTTMFMVLSSWHSHCESSPGSFDECRLSAGWPPTLRPNQPIWAVIPPKDWLLPSADTYIPKLQLDYKLNCVVQRGCNYLDAVYLYCPIKCANETDSLRS